ncbi:5-dehydro-2-deoxygluconokinase [Tessaracoccus bendigoensis DSM 12906]|uniref:5-dehydro-2-deoxygluconokinase n=1 Tax=Tessaracoccus bendigoensis DSM 12906 TaxID=1123357 RepID=A0A1M6NG46_9ACTN|nr:5-dehydro-2-deoxygluconokinase [Tessaracoccus bendigoensis]SHJ94680.1 5-dehydro-2-deoxygluconokinase [Tessaracoccus bendigoensis DSM 12906]
MDDVLASKALVIGRCGVDIYPLQVGLPLEDVQTFGKFLGGSAINVAVACARYGHRVAGLSGVGDDPFGRFVIKELERLGVDASHMVVNSKFNTPVTFCEIFPPDDFPLYFYREPSTPDLEVSVADLPADLDTYKLLWLTVGGLSAEPSRSAHLAAAKTPRPGGLTILDLDYRPYFWPSEEVARGEIGNLLEYVDVAIGNKEECRVAVNETDPERAADALLDRGVKVAIVKQGLVGTLAKTREERVFVPATRVDVINGLGAGDAFGGAVCHGLLENWDLDRIIAFASGAGAIVASRLECSTAMPYENEVDELLATHPEIVQNTQKEKR